MNKKILNNLTQITITLLGISFITFALVYLAPGDPVRTMYISTGNIPSQEIIEKTREAMGLNKPFLVQYFTWLKNILSGDFGVSYSLNQPVLDIIIIKIGKTIKLAISSLIMMISIALPLGVISAIRSNKLVDHIIRTYSSLGMAMPGFFVGTLLLYVVSLKLRLLPVVSVGNNLRSLILPSLSLAFSMSSKYIRQIRSIVLSELEKEYVLGAKARGIKYRDIIIRDVLPNTLPPLVTLLGISIGSLLSGVAVIEVIFSYPGIGSMAVDAISSYDYPLIQAYVLLISLIYMSVNFLVDISYKFLDPRIEKRMDV